MVATSLASAADAAEMQGFLNGTGVRDGTLALANMHRANGSLERGRRASCAVEENYKKIAWGANWPFIESLMRCKDRSRLCTNFDFSGCAGCTLRADGCCGAGTGLEFMEKFQSSDKRSWDDALAACEIWGGTLAKNPCPGDRSVSSKAHRGGIWVGSRRCSDWVDGECITKKDIFNEGYNEKGGWWRWMYDNEELCLGNDGEHNCWHGSEPDNNPNEHCLTMDDNSNGKYNNEECDKKYNYMCSRCEGGRAVADCSEGTHFYEKDQYACYRCTSCKTCDYTNEFRYVVLHVTVSRIK